MLIPSRRTNNDVAARVNGRAHVLKNCIGRGEFDTDVHIGQSFGPHGMLRIKYLCDDVALLASDRINLPANFAEADQRDLHIRSF